MGPALAAQSVVRTLRGLGPGPDFGEARAEADQEVIGKPLVSKGFVAFTGFHRLANYRRVVLAPGVCAPRLAVTLRADRARTVSHPQGDGGNSASLPGESTT